MIKERNLFLTLNFMSVSYKQLMWYPLQNRYFRLISLLFVTCKQYFPSKLKLCRSYTCSHIRPVVTLYATSTILVIYQPYSVVKKHRRRHLTENCWNIVFIPLPPPFFFRIMYRGHSNVVFIISCYNWIWKELV